MYHNFRYTTVRKVSKLFWLYLMLPLFQHARDWQRQMFSRLRPLINNGGSLLDSLDLVRLGWLLERLRSLRCHKLSWFEDCVNVSVNGLER